MDHMYDLMDLTVHIPQSSFKNKSMNHLKTFIPETGHHLLFSIFDTDIGKLYSDSDISILKSVELHIFERFIIRHKSMQYSRVFQQTNEEIRDKYFQKFRKIKGKISYHYTQEKKCKRQIHPAQIQEGFRTILYRVVSQELIGNNRNKKKILKTLQNLLKTAKTESYSLRNLLKQINISSMKWLNAITNVKAKCIVVAKFIKWLFHYFIEVINYQFYVSSIKEEKVFIFINDWNAQYSRQIKTLVKKMVLQPDRKLSNSNATTGNYLTMIPKRDSVRFIASNNYTVTEKDELRKVMGILRYLYEEYFKIKDNNFQMLYPDICKTYKNCESVYVISADIHDAFGSVKQDKLCNILQLAFESLPDMIELQTYKLRGSQRYRYPSTNKIKSQTAKGPHRIVRIEKCHILQILKEYIFHTKVIVNQQKFNLSKGLAQGLMLSPVLCDIYYAHMIKKCFSTFMISGFLFTYVDDSFYITDDERVEKKVYLVCGRQLFFDISWELCFRYIDIIQKGIPEYNCWFNKSKLQSNLEISEKNINYLGWQIDSRLLEVKPKYLPVRKNTIFLNLSNSTLESKIENLTPLKLSKIIFSKQINSSERIFNNIEIVALQQANRCYTLTRSICESKPTLSTKMIRKANFKIIKRIETLTDWNKKEKYQYRRKLQYIMWKSFFSVFNKHDGFKDLTKELKKLTKKYKLFTAPSKYLRLK